MNKTELKQAYRDLISKYGEKGELHTFNLCADRGLGLQGSTIDKIEDTGDDIRFYYNENTNDYDVLERFRIRELSKFHSGIVKNAPVFFLIDTQENSMDHYGIVDAYSNGDLIKNGVVDTQLLSALRMTIIRSEDYKSTKELYRDYPISNDLMIIPAEDAALLSMTSGRNYENDCYFEELMLD